MSTMPLTRPAVPSRATPRLQNGDHLDRIEFERRYRATGDTRKIELIEGRVYVSPPPASQPDHSAPLTDIIGLLVIYRMHTPGVETGTDGSVRLDLDNMPRPDAFMYYVTHPARAARVDPDRLLSGAPEFVAEVAASSASYDLHEKLNVYRRNGVREYMVWRTYDQALDYFILTDGRYEPLLPTDGAYRSRAFPGLWFDINAVLQRDINAAYRTLQLGLASPEHAAFVAELAKHKPA